VTLDNTSLQTTASAGWSSSNFRPGYVGGDYIQDGNIDKGTKIGLLQPIVGAGLVPGARQRYGRQQRGD